MCDFSCEDGFILPQISYIPKLLFTFNAALLAVIIVLVFQNINFTFFVFREALWNRLRDEGKIKLKIKYFKFTNYRQVKLTLIWKLHIK